MTGQKHDATKPKWNLLPLKQVEHITSVLTFGAQKYEAGGWRHVDDATNRYFAAALRHLTAWQTGEKLDPESGLPHLAHAACCLIFMMWFDDKLARSETTTNKFMDDANICNPEKRFRGYPWIPKK